MGTMIIKRKKETVYKKQGFSGFFCFKDFSAIVSQCRSVFFMSCALVFLCSCVTADQTQRICFQSYCFTIEIAQTPEERAKGLMFRESLPQEAGMLFVFEEPGAYGFWMKNTLISLDMVWLDEDMNVVHIEEAVNPCEQVSCPVYYSEVSAKYVLELNAGTVKKIGLKTEDQLERIDK